jgi:hypothetical protein
MSSQLFINYTFQTVFQGSCYQANYQEKFFFEFEVLRALNTRSLVFWVVTLSLPIASADFLLHFLFDPDMKAVSPKCRTLSEVHGGTTLKTVCLSYHEVTKNMKTLKFFKTFI